MLLALACNEPQVDPLRAAVLSFQAGKEALSQGDPQAAAEAFEAITATNPFSSICGRVCDAPWEALFVEAAPENHTQQHRHTPKKE